MAEVERHLVPLGEFVPPELGWIVRVLRIPLSDFTSGPERPEPLAVAKVKAVFFMLAPGEKAPEATGKRVRVTDPAPDGVLENTSPESSSRMSGTPSRPVASGFCVLASLGRASMSYTVPSTRTRAKPWARCSRAARVLARSDGGAEVLWVHGDKRV